MKQGKNYDNNLEDKKFAVLIDSDNISARYIEKILDEMTKHGMVTYKRIYGDWTSPRAAKWRSELLENGITPIQQFSNTIGKNATDSALIIDAMDILYTENVDGFCIVSSDGDFTRLASRLRESGMEVIGMGEEKTPRSFRAACTVFTNLEILLDDENEEQQEEMIESTETVSDKKKNEWKQKGNIIKNYKVPRKAIEKAIADIIIENENKGRITTLGEVGNKLVKKYPDFDVRNYGYSLLSKFLEEISTFQLVRNENTVLTVSLKENEKDTAEIIDYIKNVVRCKGKKGIGLSQLSNLIHGRYQDFNVKDFGYSQLSKFVQSLDRIIVLEDGDNRRIVYWKE